MILKNNKQNFVRRKIAVWAFGIDFKLNKIVQLEIIYIQKRVLFFFYKKVLRRAWVQGDGVCSPCLKTNMNKVRKVIINQNNLKINIY